MVTSQLTGLQQEVSWTIHSLPFPPSQLNPCHSIGPHYLNITAPLLPSTPSQNFSELTLFGRESVVGRSMLIKVNESLSVCANIGYPENAILFLAAFRGELVGNIYLRQYHDNTSSLFVSLTVPASFSPLSSLSWAILPAENSSCAIGELVYSSGVGEEGDSGRECRPGNQTQCAEGNLSGKNGNLTVVDMAVEMLLTDTHLPLPELEGLLMVLEREGSPAACSALRRVPPVKAVVEVSSAGRLEFLQISPTDLTQVTVSGLEGEEYRVYQLPPGPSSNCSDTGGIFDPRGVGADQNGPTDDFYAFGDLSGKIGDSTVYLDPYLPLVGRDGIIGRSVVMSSPLGKQCGVIQYCDPIEFTVTMATEGFNGTLTFSQSAGDPFTDTIITIETNFDPEIQLFSSSLSSQITTSPAPPGTPSPLTPSQMSSEMFLMPLPSSLLSPSPLSSSSPLPSSTFTGFGSGLEEVSTVLAPMIVPSPSPSMEGGKRRRREEWVWRRKRADASVQFSWSLRRVPSDGSVPDDCRQLEMFGRYVWSYCTKYAQELL